MTSEPIKKALVFAGTTEGGAITAFLCAAGVRVHACVATEYGRTSIPADCGAEVSDRPLTSEEMAALMREYPFVIDATHPYASSITKHIREVCQETGTEYIRIDRPSTDVMGDDVIVVKDVRAAVDFLKNTEGNILVTTGSKDVALFSEIPDSSDRVFVRVLSVVDSVDKCIAAGFTGPHLFAMQGPFCEDLDYGMLIQTGARYMVTKDSGGPGGFSEKIRAARRAKANIVIISRPAEKGGVPYEEAVRVLSERFGIPGQDPREAFKSMGRRRMFLIGTGVGEGTGLTAAASASLRRADLVVGAERMLSIPEASGKPHLMEYMPDRIFDYLGKHPEYRQIAVLLSGDVGFYSAARTISQKVDPTEYDIFSHCGISSVQYLCARIGVPWQDVKLISAHGRAANIVGEVRRSPAVFSLLDGAEGTRRMCALLQEYGLSNVTVMMGCDLGSEDEAFIYGTPAEVEKAVLGTLCAALIINNRPERSNPVSIPDSEFIRGDAPMTKSEIRALSVAKLKIGEHSVVYDVGAGTGSVSVEMARVAVEGTVYAIEKEDAAADLIDVNRHKMCTPNVEIIKGLAPEALANLPKPTRAFIGGASGNLKEIVDAILAKNPKVRFVVNAVTLETLDEVRRLPSQCAVEMLEITCVNISNAKKLGRYNLMVAQNPVYIAVFRGIAE